MSKPIELTVQGDSPDRTLGDSENAVLTLSGPSDFVCRMAELIVENTVVVGGTTTGVDGVERDIKDRGFFFS